jgi:hypothetical protein
MADLLSIYLKDILLAILGVLGGWVVSLFFYRKALQRREISFATEIDRLIWSTGPTFSDIELLYKGSKLSDPRKATIYVWNSGNCTINADEIASADRLALGASNIQILSYEIARSTREVIDAKLEPRSASETLLLFDFLDPGDGVVVEIFYDILSKEKTKGKAPRLHGTLKGSPAPPVSRDVSFQSTLLNRAGQSLSLLIVLLITAILLVFQVFEIVQESNWLLIVPKIFTAILLALVCLGISIASIVTWRAYRIPRSLKSEQSDAGFPTDINKAAELVERATEVDILKIRELHEQFSEFEKDNHSKCRAN